MPGCPSPDHPRVCGEQLACFCFCLTYKGSPPRVRGTVLVPPVLFYGLRITPACAGNRYIAMSSASAIRDHPRVCGEQSISPYSKLSLSGSPPRVRGTGGVGVQQHAKGGITPACAGNSIVPIGCVYAKGDHPRVCGEQDQEREDITIPDGSPPRVRGTVARSWRYYKNFRITPACAGNRHGFCNAGFRRRDHPRVCGEQCQRPRSIFPFSGSPPRVRGTAAQAADSITVTRITPACAGNSFRGGVPGGSEPDHPRVCGEQITPSPKIPCLTGSPPRVRGTGSSLGLPFPHFRITPACAGNSNAMKEAVE